MKRTVVLMLLAAIVLTLVSCGGHWPSNDVRVDFWKVHGWWFLLFMLMFPRITMLVATPFPIGFLSWLGWAFIPRILAAILATHYYWGVNPVLCVFAWIFALAATGATSSKTASIVNKRGS